MKRIMLALAVVLFVGSAFAGPFARARASNWGAGGCAVAQTDVNNYTGWHYSNGYGYYYELGCLRGASKDGTWWSYDGRQYTEATPPWKSVTAACKCGSVCKCDPCKCGKAASKPVDHVGDKLFGVDASKLRKDGENRYSINGKPCLRHEAFAAVELADDSAKPFVTFIGPGQENIYKAFIVTPEAAKCRVNCYTANEWPVQAGFVTKGVPTIYVQNASGEVLYRTDVDPGVAKLQVEARKAQPDYDPAKDPNGVTDPFAMVKDYLSKVPVWAWLVGGFALLLVLNKRNS